MPKKASTASSSVVESSSKSKSSYIALDQRTHILLRSDTYIGSIKFTNAEFYGVDKAITPNSLFQMYRVGKLESLEINLFKKRFE